MRLPGGFDPVLEQDLHPFSPNLSDRILNRLTSTLQCETMQNARHSSPGHESSNAPPNGDAAMPGDRRQAQEQEQRGDWTVSVVVPTCGRADLLVRCLDALTAQTVRSADMEIIVVDDAALEATRTVLAGWTERMAPRGLDIRYLPNHGPHGPAAARNRGWRAARAGIVAFTDDDTVPDADWLRNGLMAFDRDADALWGRITMPLPARPTDYERDASHLATAEFVTANCFCRKATLDALGGFDERFRLAWREDSDFHFRLLEQGARIRHVPEALVVHPVRPARWGVSIGQQKKIQFDALLYKKHPLLYRRKIRARPRWDYYLTVASLLAAPAGAALGHAPLAAGAVAVWAAMTARLCAARLKDTAKTASHVVEMAVTSAAIPVLAVWWRMVGALRFRVLFL
jgi:GT2 family glycosyltransferase